VQHFFFTTLIVFTGHNDCMDWSDELNHEAGESCSFTPNALECDEHVCPRNSYACGDGQCVEWHSNGLYQQRMIVSTSAT
jgi:hypothetical protein